MDHLYIATPTYDATVSTGYAQSLAMTVVACSKAGIALSGPDFKGGPYIDCNRNWLVHRFMQSPAQKILFIDADVTWDENAVVNLYRSGKQFCGGAYPKKEEKENYPVRLLDEVDDGFLSAQYIPGGFQMIHREVFEQLKPHVPSYPDEQQFGGETMHVYFQNLYSEKGFCGEDVTMCIRWRQLGGKVWFNPDIDFGHQGPKIWEGNYARRKIAA